MSSIELGNVSLGCNCLCHVQDAAGPSSLHSLNNSINLNSCPAGAADQQCVTAAIAPNQLALAHAAHDASEKHSSRETALPLQCPDHEGKAPTQTLLISTHTSNPLSPPVTSTRLPSDVDSCPILRTEEEEQLAVGEHEDRDSHAAQSAGPVMPKVREVGQATRSSSICKVQRQVKGICLGSDGGDLSRPSKATPASDRSNRLTTSSQNRSGNMRQLHGDHSNVEQVV
jgi:hypothetical protein